MSSTTLTSKKMSMISLVALALEEASNRILSILLVNKISKKKLWEGLISLNHHSKISLFKIMSKMSKMQRQVKRNRMMKRKKMKMLRCFVD
jgi:hypothetical protein